MCWKTGGSYMEKQKKRMKLRTRVIISFFIIILVPIVMCALTFYFFVGYKAKIIGVDVNQHPQKPNLYITSAEKKVEKTTYDAIKLYFDNNKDLTGEWPTAQAGKHEILGSVQGKIGLPTEADSAGDPWTFKNFSKDQYNTLYNKLKTSDKYTKVISNNDGKTVIDGVLNNDHVQISFESVGQSVDNKPALKKA